MRATVVISRPGTRTAFNTRRIRLKGVVFDTTMIVSRQIVLLAATTRQLPRAAGCKALTNATLRINGDSHASRFSRNSNGSRPRTTASTNITVIAKNQPNAVGGASTVPTIMISATPNLSAAGRSEERRVGKE